MVNLGNRLSDLEVLFLASMCDGIFSFDYWVDNFDLPKGLTVENFNKFQHSMLGRLSVSIASKRIISLALDMFGIDSVGDYVAYTVSDNSKNVYPFYSSYLVIVEKREVFNSKFATVGYSL